MVVRPIKPHADLSSDRVALAPIARLPRRGARHVLTALKADDCSPQAAALPVAQAESHAPTNCTGALIPSRPVWTILKRLVPFLEGLKPLTTQRDEQILGGNSAPVFHLSVSVHCLVSVFARRRFRRCASVLRSAPSLLRAKHHCLCSWFRIRCSHTFHIPDRAIGASGEEVILIFGQRLHVSAVFFHDSLPAFCGVVSVATPSAEQAHCCEQPPSFQFHRFRFLRSVFAVRQPRSVAVAEFGRSAA